MIYHVIHHFSCSGELRTIIANYAIIVSSQFWVMMFVAGVLGFAIGIVTVLQIKLTSPLTHNISGTV